MLSDSRKQEIYLELEKLRVEREARRSKVLQIKEDLEKERAGLQIIEKRLEKLLLELAGQQNLF